MVSLSKKGLLDKGEYFVIGIDIEQYDPESPEKYLRGSLLENLDKIAEEAFRSYLGIFPTAPAAFNDFAKQVSSSRLKSLVFLDISFIPGKFCANLAKIEFLGGH